MAILFGQSRATRPFKYLFLTGLWLVSFNLAHAQAAASAQAPSAIIGTTLTFEAPKAADVLAGKARLITRLSGMDSLAGVTVQYSVFLAGSEAILGIASPSAGSDGFVYSWETGQMINGVYNLKAEALSHSKKLAVSIITVELKNDPGSVPAQVIVPVSLTVTSPKEEAMATGDLFLFAKANISLTGLKFFLYDSTESVVFSGKGKLSPEPIGLTWTYGLQTARFVNGEYFIGVETILGEKAFRSPKVKFFIKNNLEKVFSQVTVLAPAEGAVLAGQAKLSASTDVAVDSLDFKIDGALSVTGDDANHLRLKAKSDTAKTKWQADWPTGQLEDGPYRVSAVALNGSLLIESSTILVSVKNGEKSVSQDSFSASAQALLDDAGDSRDIAGEQVKVPEPVRQRSFPIASIIGLLSLAMFSAVLVLMFKINRS